MANQVSGSNQSRNANENAVRLDPNMIQTLAPAQRQNNRNSSNQIDLLEYFLLLLSHWRAILLGMLAGAVLLGCYQVFFVTPTYRAEAEIYITSNDSVISLQDLQIGAALTEDYKEIITSRAVLKQVIEDLGLNVDYKGLARMISVSSPTNTHIIEISVTTTDMILSRDIANDLLNVSIDRIYQVVGTNEPNIIDFAEADAVEDATPSFVRCVGIGALFGLVVVGAALLIMMISNTTLRTEDDVERWLRLPVLAAVPYYEE